MSYDWRSDELADGYECQTCGYEPTWAEVHQGSCPECARSRQEKMDQEVEREYQESGKGPGDV